MEDTYSEPGGPVPQPRARPGAGKAPVPLPRTVIGTPNEPKSSSADSSKEDLDPNRVEETPSYKNSLTRAAKIKLRRVTSNVTERGNAVLEQTKNVGNKLESSVRSMLAKRLTTLGIPGDHVEPDKPPEDGYLKSQSLPAVDVFNSISFGSPLASEDIYVPMDNVCEGVKSLPPPSYPPPPLPDESIYDELVSARSGSSVHSEASPVPPEIPPKVNSSYFEEFPVMRNLSVASGCEAASETSSLSGAVSLPEHRLERTDSCGSWKFYDVAHGANRTKVPGPSYENVAVDENYVESSENIYSGEPTRVRVLPETPSSGSSKSSDCLVPRKVEQRPDAASSASSSRSSVSNSMYENWKPQCEDEVDSDTLKRNPRATKSVIYEFDPLFEERQKQRKLLQAQIEEKLTPDPEVDFYSIPTPPERIDSLPESDSSNPGPTNDEYLMYHRVAAGNSTFFGGEESQKDTPVQKEGSKFSSLVQWTSMKKALKTLKDGTAWSPGATRENSRVKESQPKPVQSPHSGYILKSPSNGEKPKDFVSRWCLLSEGKILLAPDKGSTNKEIIPLDDILTVSNISIPKPGNDGENIHCWELSVTGRTKPHLFGTTSLGDAKMWMRKTLESLTNVFSAKLSADFSKAGQCFLREGVTQEWTGAWILKNARVLYYCQMNEKTKLVDLRKVRLTALNHEKSEGEGCANVAEPGPFIQLHTVDRVLYLQMDSVAETKHWFNALKLASMQSGPALCDQQLNKGEVPVIVEKCTDFIYAHGLLSEGIYRRSGSNTSVTKLMSVMRADAWSVQLSRSDYTEHDVSTVLKRFFRELPDPLFSTQLHTYFCNAAGTKCITNEKIGMYRTLLDKLPAINYVTARRLIGHLHAVAEQSDKNKMPVENLAAIWAPTLLSVEGKRCLEWSKRECEVVCDLITHYKAVFLVDLEEVDRERKIQEALVKVGSSPNLPPPKPSGDFKIAVYIGAKTKECVTVEVKPSMDASEICNALASKTEYSPHELCLTEMVLGGALSRPLHHSEKVLDVALRWAYWDSNDRKDNYFLLGPNTVYREIVPLAKPPVSKCGELKFADLRSKSFKSFMFEFSQAKLSYYKDKACSVKLAEWKIEDIVWYVGHEPKRNPATRISRSLELSHPINAYLKPISSSRLIYVLPNLHQLIVVRSENLAEEKINQHQYPTMNNYNNIVNPVSDVESETESPVQYADVPASPSDNNDGGEVSTTEERGSESEMSSEEEQERQAEAANGGEEEATTSSSPEQESRGRRGQTSSLRADRMAGVRRRLRFSESTSRRDTAVRNSPYPVRSLATTERPLPPSPVRFVPETASPHIYSPTSPPPPPPLPQRSDIDMHRPSPPLYTFPTFPPPPQRRPAPLPPHARRVFYALTPLVRDFIPSPEYLIEDTRIDAQFEVIYYNVVTLLMHVFALGDGDVALSLMLTLVRQPRVVQFLRDMHALRAHYPYQTDRPNTLLGFVASPEGWRLLRCLIVDQTHAVELLTFFNEVVPTYVATFDSISTSYNLRQPSGDEGGNGGN